MGQGRSCLLAWEVCTLHPSRCLLKLTLNQYQCDVSLEIKLAEERRSVTRYVGSMVFSCSRVFNHFSGITRSTGVQCYGSPEQRLYYKVRASIDYAYARTSAKARSQIRIQSRSTYCLGSSISDSLLVKSI